MKKELLWALRDYSYTAMQNQYQDYAFDRVFCPMEDHVAFAKFMVSYSVWISIYASYNSHTKAAVTAIVEGDKARNRICDVCNPFLQMAAYPL